jgi:hypothetical protein
MASGRVFSAEEQTSNKAVKNPLLLWMRFGDADHCRDSREAGYPAQTTPLPRVGSKTGFPPSQERSEI